MGLPPLLGSSCWAPALPWMVAVAGSFLSPARRVPEPWPSLLRRLCARAGGSWGGGGAAPGEGSLCEEWGKEAGLGLGWGGSWGEEVAEEDRGRGRSRGWGRLQGRLEGAASRESPGVKGPDSLSPTPSPCFRRDSIAPARPTGLCASRRWRLSPPSEDNLAAEGCGAAEPAPWTQVPLPRGPEPLSWAPRSKDGFLTLEPTVVGAPTSFLWFLQKRGVPSIYFKGKFNNDGNDNFSPLSQLRGEKKKRGTKAFEAQEGSETATSQGPRAPRPPRTPGR